MTKHLIFTLTATKSGRIVSELIAEFSDSQDAIRYGKNKTYEIHLNVMHVSPNGHVAIYSEHE